MFIKTKTYSHKANSRGYIHTSMYNHRITIQR